MIGSCKDEWRDWKGTDGWSVHRGAHECAAFQEKGISVRKNPESGITALTFYSKNLPSTKILKENIVRLDIGVIRHGGVGGLVKKDVPFYVNNKISEIISYSTIIDENMTFTLSQSSAISFHESENIIFSAFPLDGFAKALDVFTVCIESIK